MATVAAPVEQTADLLQNLNIDSQPKTADVPETNTKKNSAGDTKGLKQSQERSTTPVVQEFIDPNMYYHSADYNQQFCHISNFDFVDGYEGVYVNPEGMDCMPNVPYTENGLFYYQNFPQYPPPAFGHDGQLFGPQSPQYQSQQYQSQQYQYPGPYYPTPSPPNSSFTPSQAPVVQADVSTSVAVDLVSLPVEATKAVNANGVANSNSNGVMPLRPNNSNSSMNSNGSYGKGGLLPNGVSASGYHDPRYAYDGISPSVPWSDTGLFPDGQNRPVTSSTMSSTVPYMNNGRNPNIRPLPHLMNSRPSSGIGTYPGYMNRYDPSRMYNQYGTMGRAAGGYALNGYDSRINGRGWLSVDSKYKSRGRGNGFLGYGNENTDGVTELPRGPRARGFKNIKGLVPITLAVKGQTVLQNVNNSENKENSSLISEKEQYNRDDFSDKYSESKCFIIKSYSEDDFHKSIKYGVWASTINGNKKLDAAYREAQEKTGGCPVFLFFSVNASGQFVGLAEMVGPVDFNKTVEYWQQDKWNGHFPVKWHIVKDVPNNLLKHITLENNDNKPVTNSRDTQEVKFEQGLQMLKIFKEFSSKTCILDDFAFYEDRQKTMVEKKAKQQQFQKQVWDGKLTVATSNDKENDESNGKLRLQKSLEVASALLKEPAATVQVNGVVKQSKDNDLVGIPRDAPKVAKPVAVTEKKVVTNGVVPDVTVANEVVNGS
ncbi:hypothetical protein GIB67_010061 [Kingdonia uniflora]|uniref:YTH domain-containing family protein n=1 Tax=Kingdonia uniflora TaxID=39325 RepID=A0A7J7KVC4_9MAGN|nr:hypothetical protein GIB67_010061 [Kingdonia uniflora]